MTEVLQNLQVGDVVDGTVQRLTNFGAFVDIGGVDGLVHISELSHSRVAQPSDVVQVGEHVKVRVLRIDPDAGKVSLSLKQALPDPWHTYANELRDGELLLGTVKRIVDFGAFVELKPGLEGLVHVSQLSNQRVNVPSDVLQVGQEVKVKILAIDSGRKRISLSIKDADNQAPRMSARGERRESKKVEWQHADVASGTGATLGDLFGDLFKRGLE